MRQRQGKIKAHHLTIYGYRYDCQWQKIDFHLLSVRYISKCDILDEMSISITLCIHE